MEYYYFAGGDHTKRINYLKTYGFSGALFTYSPFNQDYFIRIIENFKTQKIKDFKFLVAIRPYVISPQYLRMISSAINRITENSVVINLISGTIKENEKNCEGIVGNINDYSSKEERSDYLVKFLKEDFKMKNNNPGIQQNNIVVTTTNEKVFNVASSLKYKMIIPYFFYKSGH
jgi:hypothetical protein